VTSSASSSQELLLWRRSLLPLPCLLLRTQKRRVISKGLEKVGVVVQAQVPARGRVAAGVAVRARVQVEVQVPAGGEVQAPARARRRVAAVVVVVDRAPAQVRVPARVVKA